MSSMVISWLYSYTRHNDIVIVGTVPIIRGDKGYNPKMTLKKTILAPRVLQRWLRISVTIMKPREGSFKRRISYNIQILHIMCT